MVDLHSRNILCILLLAVITSMTTCAQTAQAGFGEDWVRANPFQIMALSSGAFNWDANTYAGANLNTVLNWEADLTPITGGAQIGLPWIYNVQEDPAQLADPGNVTPAQQAEILNVYNTDPNGNNGWLVYDEVTTLKMPAARTVMDYIKGQYPDALVFSNARGYGDTPGSYYGTLNPGEIPPGYGWDAYLDDHISQLQPHIMMYSLYPFNVGGGTANPYRGAGVVSAKAKAAGLPAWAFMQSFGNVAVGPVKRIPSESDIRMEVFLHLNYGFKGISYFTYEPVLGGDAMVDASGVPQPLYYDIQALNTEAFNLGERLKTLNHRNTRFVAGETAGSPNPNPAHVSPWTGNTVFGNDDYHMTHVGVDVSKPGNEGAGKDGLIGTFRDDNGNPYIMLNNMHHGEFLTAAQTELDFVMDFDWSVRELIRINRQTGQEEVIPLVNNRLKVRLPGGTGDLFRYEPVPSQVVATNFVEDFESSTDPGYTPGALLSSQNGWSVTPGAILPVGNTDPDFNGQYLDGPAVAAGPSATSYTNAAGIGGGLDPNMIYRLSWDWKMDSSSTGQSFGFLGSGTTFPWAPNQVRDLAWLANDDANQVTLRFEHNETEQEFIDFPMPSFDDPVNFQIVVDGAANVVDPQNPGAGTMNWLYGIVDGVETRRLLITDEEMMDIQMLQLLTDNGPNRHFPAIDNIMLTTEQPPPVDAVQIGFLDDFETTTDAGYTPGATFNSQNGWVQTGGSTLPIGNTDGDFSGQYLDGPAATTGGDVTFTNTAGLELFGGFDPDQVFHLSWDWKLDADSHNQSLGFQGSSTSFPFDPNTVRELNWQALTNSGAGIVRFLFEHDGTMQEVFQFSLPSFDDPVKFEIVIDGENNVVYGIMDGMVTPQFAITDAEIRDLLQLEINSDTSSGRRFPKTDNIELITGLPAHLSDPDFNEDGLVTGADFLIWQRNFGNLTGNATHAMGDASKDGKVNARDLAAWTLFYGGAPPAFAAVTTVPEPTSVTMLVFALILVGFRPRLLLSATTHGAISLR